MLGFTACPLMPGRVELVAVAGDQAADATVNVDERPEPVPFDLNNPFSMGKRVTRCLAYGMWDSWWVSQIRLVKG